jgi:hypothetical protein
MVIIRKKILMVGFCSSSCLSVDHLELNMVLLHGFVPKVEVGPNSSKQQLLDAVGRHFMSQVRTIWSEMVTSGSSVFRGNLVQTLSLIEFLLKYQ